MTQLRVHDIHVGYGRIDVIRGVSLTVKDGERVGLFGPNGHGKTTLLRAISGLVRPRSGSIVLGDVPIDRSTPRRIVQEGLIQVSQGTSMFPDMTVRENLQLGAFARGRARIAANEAAVFDIFPILGDRRAQLARTMSGGERQMLAIGVALMAEPKVLLLDEPTLGLAPKAKDLLTGALGRVVSTGLTVLLVDQDVEFLLALTDRLVLIEQGQVAFETAAGGAIDDSAVLEMYFGPQR